MSVPAVRPLLKTFWSFLTLKYTLISCLCLFSLNMQMQYRVSTPFLFFLPWVSVALGILSFVLLGNHLLAAFSIEHPFGEIFTRIEFYISIPLRVFVCYGLLLYANATLDQFPPIERPFEIMEIAGLEINLGVPFSYSWASLRSAQHSEKTNRILLNADEKKMLWAGEQIVVRIHRGFFRIPWISKLDRDEEKYSKELLQMNPTASLMWRRLINFYIEHARWDEAAETSRTYLKVDPAAYKLALHIGNTLNAVGRYDQGMPFIEYAVAAKPTYESYISFGAGLSRRGDNPRAAEALKKAVQLDPEGWEAYFQLGHVYKEMGRYTEAVETFERVLKQHPRFPFVQSELADLRKMIAGSTQGQKKQANKN
jgi:tetratricopeptide (TPR) repeat protein